MNTADQLVGCLAFLIVFGFYVLLAALLLFLAVRSFKKVKAPERAIEQGTRGAAAL